VKEFLWDFWRFFYSITIAVRRDHPFQRRDVREVMVRQIKFGGMQGFRLIAIAALILGFGTVAQSAAQLQKLGGVDVLAPLLVGVLVRDLGPLVTVLIVVSRSVSAVASELASMKSNGEIDALKGCGVSPLSYLVVPRMVGGALAIFLLATHFLMISLSAGFIFSRFFVSIPVNKFFHDILMSVDPIDFLIFVVKTFGLGFIVFGIACYSGLRTRGTSFEIPQATTGAVVRSFIFAFAFQIVISSFYYITLLSSRSVGGLF
jgi:phospholipid/cholesterol/gamma-HCH transport system permease protein